MDAVYKYGISLVAAGNFMTNDETGAALAGDAYARMEALLGVERVGGGECGSSRRDGNRRRGRDHRLWRRRRDPHICQKRHLSGRHFVFQGGQRRRQQVVANQTNSDGTHNAVLATQTGCNNVFFATESMLADSNMLQHAISWAARPLDSPVLKLQMGRQASIFAARNDMDQSQEAQDVSGNVSGGHLRQASAHPRAVENGFQFRRLILRQYRE